ncbi:MAG: hypothetical protein AAGB15_04400, partial [Pseudomonadota bacterium]
MRSLASNVLTLLIVAGIVALAGFGVAQNAVTAPGPKAEEVVVTIPKDASVRKISEILGEAGVLRDEALF